MLHTEFSKRCLHIHKLLSKNMGSTSMAKQSTYNPTTNLQRFQSLTCKKYISNQKDYKLRVSCVDSFRTFHNSSLKDLKTKNRSVLYYCIGFVSIVGGFTYLSVILYRLYCQATGKGGKAILEEAGEKIAEMQVIKHRLVTVNFNADTNSQLAWNFKPQQPYIKVRPGETALAFYTATNPTDKPIIGIATYNVLPYEAGRYFNKIQCFCFEEQQLNPHEEVDMPVFFYLDPEYCKDPRLENINDIVLSYTFFEAKEGLQLPLPSFS